MTKGWWVLVWGWNDEFGEIVSMLTIGSIVADATPSGRTLVRAYTPPRLLRARDRAYTPSRGRPGEPAEIT